MGTITSDLCLGQIEIGEKEQHALIIITCLHALYNIAGLEMLLEKCSSC